MRKCRQHIYLVLASFVVMTFEGTAQNFVEVRDGDLVLDGRPYRFVGANLWQGMHLGSITTGDRASLIQELDQLQALGVNNLRIMATSEGPKDAPWRVQPPLRETPEIYNQDLLEGLDFLLEEMASRKMKAVVCLGNFWPWSGGMAQLIAWSEGRSIPYPPPAKGGNWIKYMLFTAGFYVNQEATSMYYDHVKMIVGRTNSITEVPYRNDPTIMSWQLANEPRGMVHSKAYRNWINSAARLIKSIDQNHLVSIGSEGNTSSRLSGNRFAKDHLSEDIDYMTIHVWIQNWGWYDPTRPEETYNRALGKAVQYIDDHLAISDRINKPLVFEEFGIARDQGSYNPSSSTFWRDRFLRDIMQASLQRMGKSKLAGINFWGWSGSIRPADAGGYWKAGDPMLGDPPHEHQGWYSIYATDASTLELVKQFATKVAQGASPR
ncbi:MAG: cellulase family glycosylhydrolase [Saprospiraceae bacterium]|nr:cellulase family glycosylhydrolase [Saprospiraceae bacterium]